MTDDARCPHCHLDLSDYGLELADHKFGDKWLCQPNEAPIIGPSIEAELAKEWTALYETMDPEQQLQRSLALTRQCVAELRTLEHQLWDAIQKLQASAAIPRQVTR